jgi:phosphoheptose isomerase
VFMAISVNGGIPAEDGRERSRNLVEAIHVGNTLGCKTVGLAGNSGGAFAGLCTVAVSVDSRDPAIVEPVHSVVAHLIAELVTCILVSC